MAEIKRGAKSGGRAGGIGAIMVGLVGCIAYGYLGEGITILIGTLVYAIVGAIAGVVLGVIYGAAYRYLPGRTSIFKGISAGIVLTAVEIWLAYCLGIESNADDPAALIIGAFPLIWGVVTGLLWEPAPLITVDREKKQRIISIAAFCGGGVFVLPQIFGGSVDVLEVMASSMAGAWIFGGLAALVLVQRT
jgi:hypothetical protein